MVYRVRSGDTLSALSARFNTSVSELAKANNIYHPLPDGAYALPTLTIPGSAGGASQEIDLDGYKIKLGDNGSNSVNKSTGTYNDGGTAKANNTEKWIIDSLDADDAVTGGSKADNIDAGAGNDTINGSDGFDYIYGAYGADTINGGNGDDKINGGPGTDTLTGGAGADTFIFDGSSGGDSISDFAEGSGSDVIDLSAIGGITGFADLKDNHMSVGPGDVAIISWSGGSVFITGIAAKSDFAANDFIFG